MAVAPSLSTDPGPPAGFQARVGKIRRKGCITKTQRINYKMCQKRKKKHLIETHKNIVRKRISLHRVNENVTDLPASPVV